MDLENSLMKRANAKCELCESDQALSTFEVDGHAGASNSADTSVLICSRCLDHITGKTAIETKAWYCLSESMWSEHPAVKVLVYRVLKSLGDDPWAQDLMSQIYLEEDHLKWVEGGNDNETITSGKVVDSNGTPLQAGDSVTLIKDLDVKGANFTAKRGTTVKNISLTDDAKYVEGRVNGMRIVLVAAYLKKA